MRQGKPNSCNLCGGKVVLIYVGKEHSRSGYIYKCEGCGASVGTSVRNHLESLGTLATLETKKKRREAHLWFDKLWTTRKEREQLYHLLAQALGIPREECHFGTMSDELLDKAIEIIKKWWLEKYDK